MSYDDEERRGRAGADAGPRTLTADEFVSYWERALDDPDHLWPEDVLTEAEWKAGWEDRQAIRGLPALTLAPAEGNEIRRLRHVQAVAERVADEGPVGTCHCVLCNQDRAARDITCICPRCTQERVEGVGGRDLNPPVDPT